MERSSSFRKNPSRETCEGIIKRILMTEVLEHGNNRHFHSAADFMGYFESLYPPSDALTKQVQRAIRSLNMPKDENGCFIVNKTTEQFDQEKEITRLFSVGNVSIDPMEDYETVFLTIAPHLRKYLIHVLEDSETFKGKFLTIIETFNGLIIYTKNKKNLLILLNSLINNP